MLKLLSLAPGLVWLLFPAGMCICEYMGVPEGGTKQSQAPFGFPKEHAPWCTANKDNFAFEKAEADTELSDALTVAPATALAIATTAQSIPTVGAARHASALSHSACPRLLACVRVE